MWFSPDTRFLWARKTHRAELVCSGERSKIMRAIESASLCLLPPYHHSSFIVKLTMQLSSWRSTLNQLFEFPASCPYSRYLLFATIVVAITHCSNSLSSRQPHAINPLILCWIAIYINSIRKSNLCKNRNNSPTSVWPSLRPIFWKALWLNFVGGTSRQPRIFPLKHTLEVAGLRFSGAPKDTFLIASSLPRLRLSSSYGKVHCVDDTAGYLPSIQPEYQFYAFASTSNQKLSISPGLRSAFLTLLSNIEFNMWYGVLLFVGLHILRCAHVHLKVQGVGVLCTHTIIKFNQLHSKSYVKHRSRILFVKRWKACTCTEKIRRGQKKVTQTTRLRDNK